MLKRELQLAIDEEADAVRSLEQQLEMNAFCIAAVTAGISPTIQRERWAFERNERWFEDTLPNLGESHFKQCFRVSQTTFKYFVESCWRELSRQDTNMRRAISVEKRVAIGLYRLGSTAEDRTIAHLFALGWSTVNEVYREFFMLFLEKLEAEWLRMVRRDEMAQHMREFIAVHGFPHAVGTLDGCHFAVSPPVEQVADYSNYKGWHSIILLALVDHR